MYWKIILFKMLTSYKGIFAASFFSEYEESEYYIVLHPK